MRASSLFAIAALVAAPHAALGAGDRQYLAELTAKARELRLAERPEWRKLLHYVPNLASHGVHSLVDSPEFFNAPDGKTDPRAELEATLASFYSDVEETRERQNPQCTFIARRAWLDEQLGFDRARLPLQECKRFEAWRDALNPKALTLVFAAAYLNNPSSMYGHTLLRVDARDQDERTRLLAYTINFAANTGETSGLVFAVKGLFGWYPGQFSILPYYLKVREYTDLESRDLWEYELAFTPGEVERVLRHAWELLQVYFEYYFFDENCSYHLLRLLQVARPELDLAGSFRWWALPSDTVRAVTDQPGLVAKTVYRPSSATLIGARLERMSGEERSLAKALSVHRSSAADPALSAMQAERAAAVLETSYEYVNYRRASGKKDVAEPGALARELMLARSRLDAPAQTPAITEPGARPDQGHGSARIGVGAGRLAGSNFLELGGRPTYHDIMDPDEGYVPGAQIEFFSFALRHYEGGSSQLERLIPIEILSLAPRDEFFQSWSWKIAAGWRRDFVANGGRPLVAAVDGGAGGAWTAGRRTRLYALADAGTRFHSSLEQDYSLGAGARFGALVDFGPRWRVHAYARKLRYFLGEHDSPSSVALESRFSLGRDLALRFDLARHREAGRSFNAGSLSLLVYL